MIDLIKFRVLHGSLILPYLSLVLLIASAILRRYAKKRTSKKMSALSMFCLMCGYFLIGIYMVHNYDVTYVSVRFVLFFSVLIAVVLLIIRYKRRYQIFSTQMEGQKQLPLISPAAALPPQGSFNIPAAASNSLQQHQNHAVDHRCKRPEHNHRPRHGEHLGRHAGDESLWLCQDRHTLFSEKLRQPTFQWAAFASGYCLD